MEGIILIGILIVLAWQDLKERSVSLILLIGLFAYATFFVVWGKGSIHTTLVNMGLTSFLLLIIALYYKAKKGFKTKVIDKQIGLGDVLLLYALTPFFSSFNYLIFINAACILALGSTLLQQKRGKHIPLITYFSLTYLIAFSLNALLMEPTYHFQNDWIWV